MARFIVSLFFMGSVYLASAQSYVLDPTFGKNGISTVPLSVVTSTNDWMIRTLLDKEGNIYCTGQTPGSGTPYVFKLNKKGELSSDFAEEGIWNPNLPYNSRSLVLDGKGRLYVSGSNPTDKKFYVQRLLPTGQVDSSYGVKGYAHCPIYNPGDVFCSALDSISNKLYIGGRIWDLSNQNDFAVVRINANGIIDSTFGIRGMFIKKNDYAPKRFIHDMEVLENGQVLCLGHNDGKSMLFRLHPSGTLDSTFGSYGFLYLQFAYAYSFNRVGSTVFVVGSVYPTPTLQIGIQKVSLEGTIDGTWGTGGIAYASPKLVGLGWESLALLPNGNMVVIGDLPLPFSYQPFLALLNKSGTPDTSFSLLGYNTLDNPIVFHTVVSQPDGSFFVGGVDLNQLFVTLFVRKYIEAKKPVQPPLADSLKVFQFMSPNGDGDNETFYVNSIEGYLDNEVTIFDPAGKVVLKCKNYKNDWTADGLPNGNYFYVVKLPSVNLELKGGLVLQR